MLDTSGIFQNGSYEQRTMSEHTEIYKPQSAEGNEIQCVTSLFTPPAVHDP